MTKLPLTEIQAQGRHHRRLQLIGVFMLFILVTGGLVALFVASVWFKIPKQELTELYFIIGGLMATFTGVLGGYLFGSNISSARQNETMRSILEKEQKSPSE